MAKTWCAECGERQFQTEHGITCANGHGGAGELGEQEALALGFDITKRLRRVIAVRKPHIPNKPTIGRRSLEDRALSDATCTPKWLADYLFETHGWFDLDPCSNPRSWIHAHWAYSLEKGLDGLRLPWRGSVFKNNPFSAPLEWQLKAQHELSIGRCTELVELCKMDPGTKWWDAITAPIQRVRHLQTTALKTWHHPDLWLLDKRVQYDEHPLLVEKRRCEIADGKRKGRPDGKSSNNFCSVIIHHRFGRPRLKLEPYATLWVRPVSSPEG